MRDDRMERPASLGEVATRALDRIVQQRQGDGAVVATPELPPMPQDLSTQVAVLSGAAQFGDFRMTVEEAAFHPQAAAYAEQERRQLDPASPERVCRWLLMLTDMLGNRAPKLSDGVMQMTARTLARDLPAICFEDDALMTVLLTETHWPSIARLSELLRPLADPVRRKVRALDQIARADPTTRFRSGPARQSTEPYRPGLPPPERPPHPSMPKSDATDAELAEANLRPLARAPARTIEQQIAEVGGLATEGLLAEVRSANWVELSAQRSAVPTTGSREGGALPPPPAAPAQPPHNRRGRRGEGCNS